MVRKYIAKGRQEGRQEGAQKKALAIAQKLLGKQRPMDEIMEVTGLTREEIERLSYQF